MIRALVLAPIALSLVLACRGETTPTSEPSAAPTGVARAPVAALAASTSTADASTPAADHEKHHGGGFAWSLLRATRDLQLKEAQSTALDGIADQLRVDHRASPELETYKGALATQVRGGVVDTAKLEALRAASTKADQAHQDKEADAINGIHRVLEPAQRTAFVAAVRARKIAHEAQTSDNWAKWKLDHLTKDLDLDAEQQGKVQALIAKEGPPGATKDEHEQYVNSMLAAFATDTFDAKKITMPTPRKADMATHDQFLAALVPLLRADQREKLASSIEDRGPGAMGHEEKGPDDEAPHRGP